nr:VanW family protein [Cellulosimicrobium sp. Marseille-Q4280]
MNPVRLWEHLVGGEAKPPVVTVDEAALDAQVEALRGGLDVAPVDGTVQFVDGAPTATPATDGASVVMDSAVDAIATGWLVTDGPIELATEPVAPEITQEETDAALAEAQKVVSAPVVVTVGDQSPELPAETLAATASYAAADGALALTFDGTALVQAVVDRTNDLLTVPDDAHFVFSNGVPVIEGGAPGTTIDPAAIATAVTTAATGDDRTAPVELVESDPAQSVAALEALGVKEKVSEFSTPLTSEPVRTENLRVGASKVNGTLVLPGETFSLTEALSPITAAGGYRSAGIVQDGKHIEGVGGGLSQMATTTYNAGFFAGLEDVEHRQHSYWFTRYPAGREATIFVGSLDMRFKNDTPYGVLMQSWVGGGELHVAIWSTKHFEVETTASQKSNVVQPTTVTHTGADCVPQAAGNPGFSITNYRKVYLDGELVKDEADRWTYKPDNQVVCAP